MIKVTWTDNYSEHYRSTELIYWLKFLGNPTKGMINVIKIEQDGLVLVEYDKSR